MRDERPKRPMNRVPPSSQVGFGFELVEVARKPGPMEFIEADPGSMFVGNVRLEAYLEQIGLGWVLRLGREIERLDLGELIAAYSDQGRRAFHPRLMLSLIIYGMLMKQWSLREMEALAKRDVGAWWLCGGHQPDHSTLARF